MAKNDETPLTPGHVAERMAEIQERLKEFAPEVGDGEVVDFSINLARGEGPLAETLREYADLMHRALRVFPRDPDMPDEDHEALLRAFDAAREREQ